MLTGARRQLFKHKMGSGGGIVLGPNLLASPDGPYGAAPYTLNSVTIPQSQNQTDPFGGSTASVVQAVAATAAHFLFGTLGYTAGKFRVSGYAKPGTANFFGIQVDTGNIVAFNLTTGVGTIQVGTPAFGSSPASNGFFYCWVETMNPANGQGPVFGIGDTAAHANPQVSWTAAGTENITIIRLALQSSS